MASFTLPCEVADPAHKSTRISLIVYPGPLPPLLQAPLEFGLEAAISGPVIRSTDAQIVLFDNPTLVIVSILVAFAVAKLFRAFIVCVLQVHGNGDGAALFYVGCRLPDCRRS